MDNETRRTIQKVIDEGIANLYKEDSIKAIVEWIMDEIMSGEEDFEQEVKSAENLAVGYVIGYLARIGHTIILEKKDKEKIAALQNRVNKMGVTEIEKERGEIILKITGITNKDAKEIREIIKPKIFKIREEVIKALNT